MSGGGAATHAASCLCGDVRWEAEGPLGVPAGRVDTESPAFLLQMSHCHCARCRKHHGAPMATYVVVKRDALRLVAGADAIARFETPGGDARPFCSRCGSTVPDFESKGPRLGVPAGNFEGDLGLSPKCHIFWASRASWFDVRDDLPKFDAWPPGRVGPSLPDPPHAAPEPGLARGSCLCGEVAYALEGPGLRARTCHCSRCRKAGSAAFVAYVVTDLAHGRYTRGEDRVRTFKVPDARYFKHAFCATCGSSLPRGDHERDLFIVPMGTLDDPPPRRPERHIFVGSKVDWDIVSDDLPQDLAHAPA